MKFIDWVAIYAAIMSTAAFGWTAYRAYRRWRLERATRRLGRELARLPVPPARRWFHLDP